MLHLPAQKRFGAGFITGQKPLRHADHVFGTKQETHKGGADATVRATVERLGPIAHMRQVHGDRIVFAQNSGLYEECDALFTTKSDTWLAVKTADCVPVLVSSPVAVAVAHCGWRGLEQHLLPKLLEKLMGEFYLSPMDLFIHIGPCIRRRFYEVDEHFTTKFNEQFFIQSDKPGKVRMDIAGIAKQQALNMGVPELNVYDTGLCTYGEDELFHSYRRAKQAQDSSYQVQLSLVRRSENADDLNYLSM